MPEPELIWIIGASDGIGAAVARAWAKLGARLILSARSTEKLQSLATELGPEHVVLPLDIGTRSSVDEVTAKIAEIGPLSRVLHFAALYDPG
ncbi:MAG: SDR family NAD(P)-dependent oxidoreductase, partial [Paracoccaceae bacterium]|nr:SDR family NAD(P)-dependent oxidoreductase [Paracoccaceae bacterium]